MKRLLKCSIVMFVGIMLMALNQYAQLTANFSQAVDKPLDAPSGSAGAAKNAEGVKHYNKGDMAAAEKSFIAALKADPKLAEAHYNLAVTLHNQEAHGEAIPHFKKALKLAPNKPSIAESGILKGHLGIK